MLFKNNVSNKLAESVTLIQVNDPSTRHEVVSVRETEDSHKNVLFLRIYN